MAGFYSKLSILPLVAITPAADDGCMADTTAVDARRRTLSWIALSAVYVVWGSIHLAIRVGVGHLRPLFLAGTRHVIAGALYPIALRAQTRSSGSGQGSATAGAKAWLACAVIRILLLFADHGCLTIGETTLPGLRRRAVSTVPLWMTRCRNLHTRRNAGQVITTAANAPISAVRVNDQSQFLLADELGCRQVS
jgi:hypothetical protein